MVETKLDSFLFNNSQDYQTQDDNLPAGLLLHGGEPKYQGIGGDEKSQQCSDVPGSQAVPSLQVSLPAL